MVRFIFIFIILITKTIHAGETGYVEIAHDKSTSKPVLSYFQAAILGTIQGITEFLPISSTGHLIITNHLLQLDSNSAAPKERQHQTANYTIKNASDSYAIVIQGGTIFAILFLYWKRICSILAGLMGRNSRGLKLARNILLAFFPAACLGLLLGKWIETYLFNPQMVMIALILGAILMLGLEKFRSLFTHIESKDQELDLPDLTVKQSLSIGLLQCLAMWPGISRSMITIIGGYILGLSINKAAEFSFLLGLVTLSAATLYKLLNEGTHMIQVLSIGPAIFGCAIAFITGAIAVKWLIKYLTNHGLSLFAWYRLILAIGIFFSTHN